MDFAAMGYSLVGLKKGLKKFMEDRPITATSHGGDAKLPFKEATCFGIH